MALSLFCIFLRIGWCVLAKTLVFGRVVLKPDQFSTIGQWLVFFADVLSLGRMRIGGSLATVTVETAVHVLRLGGKGLVNVHLINEMGAELFDINLTQKIISSIM